MFVLGDNAKVLVATKLIRKLNFGHVFCMRIVRFSGGGCGHGLVFRSLVRVHVYVVRVLFVVLFWVSVCRFFQCYVQTVVDLFCVPSTLRPVRAIYSNYKHE